MKRSGGRYEIREGKPVLVEGPTKPASAEASAGQAAPKDSMPAKAPAAAGKRKE